MNNGPYRNIPSLKTLRAAFGPERGSAVRRLLDGRTDPETVPAVDAWVRACYHPPTASEKIEKACDAVLGGFGDEAIFVGCSPEPAAVYVNFGDSYATTLLFDYARSSVYVTSWGNWVETAERTRRYKFA